MKELTAGFQSIALLSLLFLPSLSFVIDTLSVLAIYILQLQMNLMHFFANSISNPKHPKKEFIDNCNVINNKLII